MTENEYSLTTGQHFTQQEVEDLVNENARLLRENTKLIGNLKELGAFADKLAEKDNIVEKLVTKYNELNNLYRQKING